MFGPTFAGVRGVSPVVREHPLNRGRVAWWMAIPGQIGGGTLLDLMGTYPAAIQGSPSWVNSRPFAGLSLDGSTQYASAPAPNLGSLADVTYGVRFTPSSAGVSSGCLIGRQATAGDTPRACFCYYGGGSIVSDSYSAYAFSASYTLSAGVESSFAFSVAGGSGTGGQFYRDGLPLLTAQLATGAVNNNAGWPFWVGGAAYSAGFAGVIHEAWVYNRVLSADEVAQLADQSRRGYPDLLRRGQGLLLTPSPSGFRPAWLGSRPVMGVGIC